MPASYRIEFTIQRDEDGDGAYSDIGFGSSGGNGNIGAALYEVESIIDNRQWETTPGMPDPDAIAGEVPDAT
jgi:hypothetical protein